MQIFKFFLAFSLLLGSVSAPAKELDLESLTAADAQQIAAEKAEQNLNIPTTIRGILIRRIRTYFSRTPELNQPLPQQEIEHLVEDSSAVARTFEEDDRSGEFNGFVEQNLQPFVRSLNPRNVVGKIGSWTVESLVVSRMLNFLTQHQDFAKRALGLILGSHLKGATRLVPTLVLTSVGYYLYPHLGGAIGGFLISNLLGGFQAGTIGPMVGAGTGWVIRPTTEELKRLEARYMSKLEVSINKFYDSFNSKSTDGQASGANDRMIPASLDTDGMDFAGMTPEDQMVNWEHGMNTFVVTAKRFNQLLRDTHHAGRDFMMLSWTDQQNITQLVETMNSKIAILRAEADGILSPHKANFMFRNENEKKIELERAYEEFETSCNKIWLDPDLDEAGRAALAAEVEKARDRLEGFGISAYEIKRLLVVQQERARAIGTMVATLAIGETRAFYHPERNRNLADPAARIDRAIRSGLGTQHYVDQHLPLVQRQLRYMTLQVKGRTGPVDADQEKCLIIELRTAFNMPPVTISNTKTCEKLLFGRPENPRFAIGPDDGPTAQLLQRFSSPAKRNEAISILNEAAFTSARKFDVQAGAQAALQNCTLH